MSYRELLTENFDRIEAIVLFLSILELIKQNYATVNQSAIFGDIRISPTERTFQEEEFNFVLDD
jgi:chromatin segregation and condensation protein Rec8/ScpA/Scc1 (kleisin family)